MNLIHRCMGLTDSYSTLPRLILGGWEKDSPCTMVIWKMVVSHIPSLSPSVELCFQSGQWLCLGSKEREKEIPCLLLQLYSAYFLCPWEVKGRNKLTVWLIQHSDPWVKKLLNNPFSRQWGGGYSESGVSHSDTDSYSGLSWGKPYQLPLFPYLQYHLSPHLFGLLWESDENTNIKAFWKCQTLACRK